MRLMRSARLIFAFAVLLTPAAAGAAGEAPAPAAKPAAVGAPAAKNKPASKKAPKTAPPAAEVPYPPSVLTGDAYLQCTISAKENGHQKLTIANGGGLEFDAEVSPIIDGKVTTAGPDKGGSYKFTSHLAKPTTARLPGVGTFDLDELETKVAVDMNRYKQPAGKGTELSFSSIDMSRRGIYIEFAGRGHAKNGDRFTFRANMGAPTDGSGRVVPADDDDESDMTSKVVYVRAPVTTVLVTTTIDRTPGDAVPARAPAQTSPGGKGVQAPAQMSPGAKGR